MAIGDAKTWSAPAGEGPSAEQRRKDHLATLCAALFSRLRHLSGLTRTSAKLVRAAALLYDEVKQEAAAGHPPASRNGRGIWKSGDLGQLTPSQRRIVLDALRTDPSAGVSPVKKRQIPRSRKAAMRGVAVRIAALVEIAAGLDEVGIQDTSILAIRDDGEAIEIDVSGGLYARQNAEAGLQRAALWNAISLRPIRAVCVVAEAPPPAHLVEAGQPLVVAARRLMQRQLEQILSRQYGLAYFADLEYVHEMRVATRRLRAAMQIFSKAFTTGLGRQRAQLSVLGSLLGDARDCDVFLEFLQGYAEKFPRLSRQFLKGLMRSEQRARRRHYRKLIDVCRSGKHRKFLDDLYHRVRVSATCAEQIEASEKGLCQTVRRGVRKSLGRHYSDVLRFGRSLSALSPDQQHQLRIACKKMRYVGEFLSEAYPSPMQTLTTNMVQMQDLLGKAHDADVYVGRLVSYYKRRKKKPDAKSAKTLQKVRSQLRRRKKRSLEKAAATWKAFLTPGLQAQLAPLFSSPDTAR